MDAFTIQIAGLVTRVQPMFLSTREYCRGYLSEQEAEFSVEVTAPDLLYEQTMWEKEALEEGLRIRKFSDPFLERATIQRKITRELVKHDTISLHGSTVAVDGKAYLFTAPCGTGKSTHTRFWREIFGDRAVMVNDDKAFLRVSDSGVFAYGSPWSGKHGLDTNICVPLNGICFLSRGNENRIHRIGVQDCLDELLHQCFIPDDVAGKEKVTELVNALAACVPLWKMECTKDPQAALVSYNVMSDINE